MADFAEEISRSLETEPGEEQEEIRRRIPPLFLLFLGAAVLGAALIGYALLKIAPDVTEVVNSRYCLTCHAELAQDFKKETVHLPFSAKRCISCHTEHGLKLVETVTVIERVFGKKVNRKNSQLQIPEGEVRTSDKAPRPPKVSKLTMKEKKLCGGSCHKDLVKLENKKTYVMPPFKKKQCLSCHQAHASNQAFLLNSPTKSLCLSCHPEISKYFLRANQHPPFKAGDCTSCHRGHASNAKPLLRRNPKVLCMGCHPSVATLMDLPVKMEPFEKGNCPLCHDPHGSPYKKLLKKPAPELCYSCHLKIAKLQKKPVQMPPFRQGLCLGCHRPHASENKKLLVAPLEKNEICYLCHEDVKGNYKTIGHNKVVNNASAYQPEAGIGSCLNCHDPHGSDYEGLIQKEVIALCLTCHGPRRYFAHPIGFEWQDPWRGGYLRCTSCHNPMGTGITRLKIRDLDGLCLRCHEADDPSFIYSDRGAWHYQVPGAR